MTGDQPTPVGYKPEQHVTPGLRIGARVRMLKPDDVFIDAGTEGCVVNTAPGRPGFPSRARVLWETDQVCMVDAGDIEVIPVVVEPKPPSEQVAS